MTSAQSTPALEPRVRAGAHFMSGDEACAEGALAAGLQLFAGYPITPSTEVMERLAVRLPLAGGTFVQMEDELASMAAIVGGSVAGARAMTAPSGPGFSLMMENIGLAVMMEAPVVVINVMRGGPSTGLPTLVGQGDVMQARYGSHGDYAVVAYAPASPQECFDLTIEAFNVADELRVPVFVLADEVVGHMTERVEIPPADKIPRRERPRPPVPGSNGAFKPFAADKKTGVPPMAYAGEGYRVHFTSLTHDERGYPSMDQAVHEALVRRLVSKVEDKAETLCRVEEFMTDDATVLVVAYGCVARSARLAVRLARAQGIKAGLLRLVTLWPFPEAAVRRLAAGRRKVVVAELNLGMMAREVERVIRKPVGLVTRPGGHILEPETILAGLSS